MNDWIFRRFSILMWCRYCKANNQITSCSGWKDSVHFGSGRLWGQRLGHGRRRYLFLYLLLKRLLNLLLFLLLNLGWRWFGALGRLRLLLVFNGLLLIILLPLHHVFEGLDRWDAVSLKFRLIHNFHIGRVLQWVVARLSSCSRFDWWLLWCTILKSLDLGKCEIVWWILLVNCSCGRLTRY